MKCTSAIFVCAAVLSAQDLDFKTGQAARLVIGQTTFTSQDPNSSDTILGAASGLAYGGDTLFIVDSNRVGAFPSNHRVLVYKGISSQIPSPTDELNWTTKCPACVGKATLVLGQPDFTTTTESIPATQSSLRLPTAVATDGVRLVIADTNHNRVMIWNRIPTINNQPADVVLGQDTFTTAGLPGQTPTAKSMRGPQGVWIGNGKLFVADTQNNRVMIWNRIPTANGTPADVVLGVPNFTTFVQPDLTQQQHDVSGSKLLNPVAVSSDGTRLFITDLGYNRVLVWNTIPTSNGAAADFALGQPDLNSSVANYGFKIEGTDPATAKQTPVLCTTSNGTDSNKNPTYPARCTATLNFPRFALASGNRLFVADGGNDRILIWNQIPTRSGQPADIVIGQIGGDVNQATDAADSLRTPMGLAWDGTNLYVSDAYNRRVTVYSVGLNTVPYQGVRNSASFEIFATGDFTVGGSNHAGDLITLKIGDIEYKHTVKSTDTLEFIVTTLATSINGSREGKGDPLVTVVPDIINRRLLLKARVSGPAGNDVAISVTVSSSSQVVVVASGATLNGGGDAARIAPGTIVSLIGEKLAPRTAYADLTKSPLPTELGGVQVYFNGIRAPLTMVSPTQINAQVPWEVQDSTSINAWVRIVEPDGTVTATTPVAVSIVPANPGIFTQPNDPTAGLVYHGSSAATGIVSVDGTATENDTATITIDNRSYTYTVKKDDTLAIIRDRLVELINADPLVTAYSAGMFQRIIIKARIEGPAGNGIPISATSNTGGSVVMSAFTEKLCCANVEGSLVTYENPAVPGEVLVVYATGLGLPVFDDTIKPLVNTGEQYPIGGPETQPVSQREDDPGCCFVSSLAGGKTADVLSATLQPGTVGTYRVVLHLNSDIPTSAAVPVTIAQSEFVSNIVTFPLVNPNSTEPGPAPPPTPTTPNPVPPQQGGGGNPGSGTGSGGSGAGSGGGSQPDNPGSGVRPANRSAAPVHGSREGQTAPTAPRSRSVAGPRSRTSPQIVH